jgi:hypothetical protein
MDPIQKIVDERGQVYGHPAVGHNRTARMFTAYFEAKGGLEVTAHDVCMLNILQKIARTMHGRPTKDTLQDIAGYALNAEIVEETRKSKLGVPAVSPRVLWSHLGEARPAFDDIEATS